MARGHIRAPAASGEARGSELYEQQAFVFQRAYALQFHIEVSASLLSEWTAVPEYAASLAAVPGPDPAAELLAQVRRAHDESVALARSLFSRWLERVAGLGSAPS